MYILTFVLVKLQRQEAITVLLNGLIAIKKTDIQYRWMHSRGKGMNRWTEISNTLEPELTERSKWSNVKQLLRKQM